MAKGMAKGLGGLVTAPSIPGTRKARAKPATAPAAAATAEAARSLSAGPFGARPARGKPRYLGLILTAILLLCLALVAAWSSFFLASGGDPQQTEQVQTAETGAVTGGTEGIDDEMLADGQAAGAMAGDAAPVERAATAPDGTAVDSESPAPVALLGAEDEIFLSAADAPPPAFDALSLPAPGTAAEAPPGEPMPPPPYGTVYRYDENGLLIPTVEGIPTPDGFMLYEGKPPKVPPARSAVAEAAAAAASAPAAEPAVATTEPAPAPAPAEAAAEAGTTGPGNPSLVEATPVDETPAPAPAAAGPEAQPDPELADRRPRARPEGLVPDEDAALDAPEATAAEFASLRPRARPSSVETAAETARTETAAASLAREEVVIELASAAAPSAGLSAEEAANPSVLTISRRPAARPKDFSRAVEAAVAAAVRAPDPAPAPEAAPAPKSAARAPEAKPDEADEIDEPEVASSPAPKIPTKASVAKQATFSKAINLSKINLIGVYGTQSNRHALVRLANGKYRKVSVGDKIDGGQVQAITANEVRYQKGGRLLALTMPKG
ncbi:hypothetical protein XINFAN_03611 [Pseudogemmobacter humi]|uniref:Type IV pilus biogenesis n=1 Tax=Pseudogemmobacter humi TaxID=2483812 RepID=A0A3P5XY36_9RHOB|nr:hypothetical protein XINFAN_03611 [Pseudogemmobacter humi]